MKWKYLCSAAFIAGLTAPAFAESLDRNALPVDMLFESGDSIRVSFTMPKPDASAAPVGGSGSVLKSYVTYGFAYKKQINDRIDLGLFVNQPYGASGGYTGGFLDGYTLDVQSNEIAAVLKYKFDNNVSVYGGLRAVQSELDLSLPAAIVPPTGYALNTGKDVGFGFLVGAAMEFPERAAKIGITYTSKIKHSFDSTEFGTTAFGQTKMTMPQSVTLDGRMALNSKTLLFGSVKWADYSEFGVSAPGFSTLVAPGDVIDYTTDSLTANIGLGRKINDEWSVFGIVDLTKTDGKASSLRPTDGGTALTLGANYERGQIKITGGVQYKKFKDATVGGASYTNSTALTPFVQIGYSF